MRGLGLTIGCVLLAGAGAVLAEDYNGDGLADLAIASVSSAGVTPLSLVSLYINQSR